MDSKTVEESLSQYLRDNVRQDVTGESYDLCFNDKPRNVFLTGHLLSKEYEVEPKDTISLDFKPIFTDEPLRVEIEFKIFYPAFPDSQEIESVEEKVRGSCSESERHPILNGFYKSLEFRSSIKVDNVSELETEVQNMSESFVDKVKEDLEEKKSDIIDVTSIEEYSTFSEFPPQPEDSRSQEEELKLFKSSIRDCALSEIQNRIEEFNLDIRIQNPNRSDKVSIVFQNKCDINDETHSHSSMKTIFNPKITLEGDFRPFKYNGLQEDNYRYSDRVWCIGTNISSRSELGEGRRKISTEFMPSVSQKEFVSSDRNIGEVLDFEFLSGCEPKSLSEISNKMKKYIGKWERGEFQPRKNTQVEDLSEDELEIYNDSIQKFRNEIKNFEEGVEELESNKDLHRAFKLMNKSSLLQHHDWNNDFRSWRLFQLVFIISKITRITDDEEKANQRADVLWFPTGGGKTEAYIGLILICLFYDRIRGKEKGMSSWIRFPRRLLSRQQSRRFLSAIMSANEVLKEEIPNSNQFSLGALLGSGDTPNWVWNPSPKSDSFAKKELNKLQNEIIEEPGKSDGDAIERTGLIGSCPKCDGKLGITLENHEIATICTNNSCSSDRLPFYLTNADVYNNVPSVVIGSLDALAQMGVTPISRNLIGRTTHKCTKHGYVGADGCKKCSSPLCDEDGETHRTKPIEEFHDPIPTLHMVDEVHMLEEELGCIASHYEKTYLEICQKVSPNDKIPSILCSTATISNAQDHISEIFGLDSVEVFPNRGPNKHESFYGKREENTLRTYIGVVPSMDTVTKSNLLLTTVHVYHSRIRKMLEIYEKDSEELKKILDINCSDDRLRKAIRMYEISIAYFLSRTRKDKYMSNIGDEFENRKMFYSTSSNINIDQLTSDKANIEIEKYEAVEHNEKDKSYSERTDTIAATSSISHGIDVNAFNFMIFNSQPSETFEYIQSSSRVGRKSGVPGIVMTIYDRNKKRDKSRYRYFRTNHEHMERMVDPVPIDRWSIDALRNTYYGVRNMVFLAYYLPRSYEDFGNIRETSNLTEAAKSDQIMKENEFIDIMLSCYNVKDKEGRFYKELMGEHEGPSSLRGLEQEFERWKDSNVNVNWGTLMYNENDLMASYRNIGEGYDISPFVDEVNLTEVIKYE